MIDLIAELPINIGLIELENLTVKSDPAAFQQLQLCAQKYYQEYHNTHLSEIPGVDLARKLFRSLHIEPTKHRPASEALLRRAIKGLNLYSVNNLVDICNWFALKTLLPNGVYDRDKISPPIILRRGNPGEEYIGHTGLPVHLTDRYTLIDKIGTFGSPITDSLRTAVTEQTKAALIIIYAPQEYNRESLYNQCQELTSEIIKFCGGVVVQQKVIGKG